MHEVEKLCSQVAIIYKGRLQAEGTPHRLLDEFEQPDLEELFFFLVDRADKESALTGLEGHSGARGYNHNRD